MSSQWIQYGVPQFNVPVYANLAAFPSSAANGSLAVAGDTHILYEWDGVSSWLTMSGSTAVLATANLDSQAANARGVAIASNAISLQSADVTYPGVVNNTAQSFSGQKTFSTGITGTLTGAASLNVLTTAKGNANGVASLDVNALIPVNQIPPAALERLVIVADQTARFALTTATVQNGDTVYQTDTVTMYFVKDDTNLGNSAGYAIYSAGTSVNFSGTLSGDVSGGQASTSVNKINGTSMAGLGTGILKNTTGTGVPSIAVAGDFPTLNQSTSGTAANVTGTVAIANGGTGQTAKAAAFDALSPMSTLGDITYGGASGTGTKLAGNITTTKKFLNQTGDSVNSAAPNWGTIANTDLSGITNTQLSGSAAITNANLASMATLTIKGNNTGSGSTPLDLTVSQVNTMLGTLSNPMTTGGDLIYGGSSGTPTRLANGTVSYVLTSAGTTLAPTWSQVSLTAGVTGTLPVANGGTGVTSSTGTVAVVLSTSPVLVTPTLGVASATSVACALGAEGTPSFPFTGDLDTGAWSSGANTYNLSTGGAERMRIDSAGNVGIGITPAAKLHVGTGTGWGSGVRVSGSNDNAEFYMSADNIAALDCRIDGGSSGGTLLLNPSGGLVISTGVYNSTTASAANVFIFTDGTLQRSTSSIKYKEEIQSDVEGGVIYNINPITYKSKCTMDDPLKRHYGFIAEELDLIDSKLVHRGADGTPEGVQYERVTVLLVKALQELNKKFDDYVATHP